MTSSPEYNRRWREKNPTYHRDWQRAHRHEVAASRERLKIEVLGHYAHGTPHCACCGEATLAFLTLDHVDGSGAEVRRANPSMAGTNLYRRLRRLGFPPGYRVLCLNCNFAVGAYRKCPHPNGVTVEQVEPPEPQATLWDDPLEHQDANEERRGER